MRRASRKVREKSSVVDLKIRSVDGCPVAQPGELLPLKRSGEQACRFRHVRLERFDQTNQLVGKREENHIPVGIDAAGFDEIQHFIMREHLLTDAPNQRFLGSRSKRIPLQTDVPRTEQSSQTVSAEASK